FLCAPGHREERDVRMVYVRGVKNMRLQSVKERLTATNGVTATSRKIIATTSLGVSRHRSNGRGSQSGMGIDRGLPCHEFEPSTTKDPPYSKQKTGQTLNQDSSFKTVKGKKNNKKSPSPPPETSNKKLRTHEVETTNRLSDLHVEDPPATENENRRERLASSLPKIPKDTTNHNRKFNFWDERTRKRKEAMEAEKQNLKPPPPPQHHQWENSPLSHNQPHLNQ
ncbi:hypothetical protein TNCV_5074021, partial [Trichonephila clavipes]